VAVFAKVSPITELDRQTFHTSHSQQPAWPRRICYKNAY